MRELKSRGCVTVRDTETGDIRAWISSRRQIYYFTRGKWQPNNFTYSTRNMNFLILATPYTCWRLNVLQLNNCYTDIAICLCVQLGSVYEPCV